MPLTHSRSTSAVFLTAGWLSISASCLAALPLFAGDETTLNAETFPAVHAQIRPQPGESRWMDIPWFTDLHAARRKAAKEGKPLFIMAAGKATSLGTC